MSELIWQIGIPAAAVATLVVLTIVLRARRRPKTAPSAPAEPLLRVDQLEDRGPPDEAVTLNVYHIPMRLAALVLAPLGRDTRLPPPEQLGELVDQLVPDFRRVVDSHQPAFARWPAQLSSQGFVRSFFRHVGLPGQRGKGTPWCSLAGRLETPSQTYLVGLVCRSESPNSLGEVEVLQATKWLDILKVGK